VQHTETSLSVSAHSLVQCRLRGKIDTNGVATAYLEERFSPGINFVMSAELDHFHSNYKFGFGVVAGEVATAMLATAYLVAGKASFLVLRLLCSSYSSPNYLPAATCLPICLISSIRASINLIFHPSIYQSIHLCTKTEQASFHDLLFSPLWDASIPA